MSARVNRQPGGRGQVRVVLHGYCLVQMVLHNKECQHICFLEITTNCMAGQFVTTNFLNLDELDIIPVAQTLFLFSEMVTRCPMTDGNSKPYRDSQLLEPFT